MMRGMKIRRLAAMFYMFPLALVLAQDITVYVVEPGGHTPAPPYTNWAMAATSVIDAVNTATNNGWTNVVVSNGVYCLTNQIRIASKLYLRSWHDGALDATNTILDGNNHPGKDVTNRVLVISHADALVEGFAIRGGYKGAGGDVYGGGGVFVSAGTLRRCLVISNYTTTHGGGVYCNPSGNIQSCRIVSNSAAKLGGGISCFYNCRVENCDMISNQANDATDGGGGIFMRYAGGVMSNCRVMHNSGIARGGGAFLYDGASANRCIFSHNTAGTEGGGVYIRDGNTVSNCLMHGNTANYGGGIYIRATLGNLSQSTVVSNHAATSGGGVYCYDNSVSKGPVLNCIVYDNTSGGASSNHGNCAGTWLPWTNSCTAPIDLLVGSGNLGADPQWVDVAGGDFRLKNSSQCLNAGMPLEGLAGTLDLDGHSRVDRMTGRVDMGAYEYIYRGTLFHCR